jgi:hypothetical protein
MPSTANSSRLPVNTNNFYCQNPECYMRTFRRNENINQCSVNIDAVPTSSNWKPENRPRRDFRACRDSPLLELNYNGHALPPNRPSRTLRPFPLSRSPPSLPIRATEEGGEKAMATAENKRPRISSGVEKRPSRKEVLLLISSHSPLLDWYSSAASPT